MRRQVLRVLIATLVAFAVLGAGSTASAQKSDLVCTFAITLHFDPGIGLLARPTPLTGELVAGKALSPATPCSSPLVGAPYTSGTADVTGSGTLGCTLLSESGRLAGSVSGTLSIAWDNGDTSTLEFSATYAALVPVVSAKVTAGALQGSTVTVLPLPTGISGNCLTGVTSLSFVGAIGFLPLSTSAAPTSRSGDRVQRQSKAARRARARQHAQRIRQAKADARRHARHRARAA